MSTRVTLFVNSLRAGGAERVCVTLANELHALGWSVQILVLNLRGAAFHTAVHPDVPVIDLGVEHARGSALPLARYLRRHRPDQILVFNHQLAVVLVWLRALRVASFGIVARNISTLSRKAALQTSLWHRYVVTALTFLFLRRVDLIIAQSEGMKGDLTGNFGVCERRVRVIRNPLSQHFTQPAGTQPTPWPLRSNEILFVGRLNRVKGLELLLAAATICLRSDQRLRLRFVGDGDQRGLLQQQAQAAGVAERVVFEGQVANPAGFYANARVVALTSHYEGFPNVLIEALSQGTPIVSVDCASGPAEIVQHGINGYLVPGRDVHAFASALTQALGRDWDTTAVQKTVGEFAPARIAQQYAAELSAAGRLAPA